jgi:hypothetical protein
VPLSGTSFQHTSRSSNDAARVSHSGTLPEDEERQQPQVIDVYPFEHGQVEVQILADEPEHVQVMVSVDDGSLPASLIPAIDSFVRAKRPR